MRNNYTTTSYNLRKMIHNENNDAPSSEENITENQTPNSNKKAL